MKPVLAFFLVFVVIPACFAAEPPCTAASFLSKLCVSSQALPLGGAEVVNLVCDPAPQHPQVYAAFHRSYEIAPVWFQQRLCAVQKLAVYTPATGTTLSWSYFVRGGFIGVSKILVDEKHDLAAHGAIMLRQAYRGKTPAPGTALPPSFGYHGTTGSSSEGLLYLLAHEMGHLIYNPLEEELRRGSFHSCKVYWGTYSCPPFRESQFGFLDWLTGHGEAGKILRGSVRPENDFLRAFILKDAPATIAPEEIDAFMRALHRSSFVSPFALYSPEEDFCETFTHLVMAEASAPLTFHSLNGEVVDVWQRVRTPTQPQLLQKIEAVRQRLLPPAMDL